MRACCFAELCLARLLLVILRLAQEGHDLLDAGPLGVLRGELEKERVVGEGAVEVLQLQARVGPVQVASERFLLLAMALEYISSAEANSFREKKSLPML